MNLRNIKLIIEYDGAAYAGWQYQTNALSIQQVMEDVLETLTHDKTQLTASGRTDGIQKATTLSLISESVGISTSQTAPRPKPSTGSTQRLGRRS